MSDFYSFRVKSIDGVSDLLAPLRGSVALVVNVASQCGYTPQYAGLERLYRELKGQRFTVIGFPCNQFGQQEPGAEADIMRFCTINYNVTFPLSAKIDVNGREPSSAVRLADRAGERLRGRPPVEFREVPGRPPRQADRPLSFGHQARRQRAAAGNRAGPLKSLTTGYSAFFTRSRSPSSRARRSRSRALPPAFGPLPGLFASWPLSSMPIVCAERERRRHVRIAHAAGLVEPIAEVLPGQQLLPRHALRPTASAPST